MVVDPRKHESVQQLGRVIATAATTLLIGIFIFDQIADVMPTPEQNGLANATNTVITTSGNAFTLGGVAIIVLVATVMLFLIGGGFGGGGNQPPREGGGNQPPRGGNGENGGTPPMH